MDFSRVTKKDLIAAVKEQEAEIKALKEGNVSGGGCDDLEADLEAKEAYIVDLTNRITELEEAGIPGSLEVAADHFEGLEAVQSIFYDLKNITLSTLQKVWLSIEEIPAEDDLVGVKIAIKTITNPDAPLVVVKKAIKTAYDLIEANFTHLSHVAHCEATFLIPAGEQFDTLTGGNLINDDTPDEDVILEQHKEHGEDWIEPDEDPEDGTPGEGPAATNAMPQQSPDPDGIDWMNEE